MSSSAHGVTDCTYGMTGDEVFFFSFSFLNPPTPKLIQFPMYMGLSDGHAVGNETQQANTVLQTAFSIHT